MKLTMQLPQRSRERAPRVRARRCALAGPLLLFLGLLALSLATSASASETAYAQVPATVYSSPTAASPVLAQLDAGDPVIAHGAEGDWVNVDVDVGGKQTNGWVQAGSLGPEAP